MLPSRQVTVLGAKGVDGSACSGCSGVPRSSPSSADHVGFAPGASTCKPLCQ